ncbi:MAG: hypothetical protein KKF00_08130 [Proteobacteria bacterium]|nr:hypothetical protein [Pseudomonadota bacterium]
MNDKQDKPAPVAPPAYYAPYPYAGPYAEENDEINLLDLFLVLVRHKVMILTVVVITGIAAVIISLLMQNIYGSEATISLRSEEKGASFSLPGAFGGLGAMVAGGFGIGGGGTLEKLEVVLKSRALSTRVIEKYDLMPILFPKEWDAVKKAWITKGPKDKPPTLQDGIKIIQKNLLKVNRDKKNNTISVMFEYPDPETVKIIVDYYLTELSETLREEVLKDSKDNQHFFNKQLEKTSDALLREKIYTLLAGEIEKETFALAQKYYSFVILDPPVVPDIDKKVKPKRALICILSVVVAFFVAIFLSFFLEFLGRVKLEDPERYKAMKDGIFFKKKTG